MPQKSTKNNPVFIDRKLINDLERDFKAADATQYVAIKLYYYHAMEDEWPPADLQKAARAIGVDPRHIQRHVDKLTLEGYCRVVDGSLTGCWRGVDRMSPPNKPAKSKRKSPIIEDNITTDNSNKRRGAKRHHSEWKPDRKFIEQILKRYKISEGDLMRRIQSMRDYCDSHGKQYADYNATVRSWLQRDNVPEREPELPANYRNPAHSSLAEWGDWRHATKKSH